MISLYTKLSRLTVNEPANNEPQLKTFSNGDIRILTEDEYKNKIKILEENEIEYHQLKAEKKIRVAIHELHLETKI